MTQATDEDRAHFCTYAQAYAAIPDGLPFRSNGYRHVAVNTTTGHRIPCADAFIAAGYVAGSAELFPHWRFHLQMGEETVLSIQPHPRFRERIRNPDHWMQHEHEERLAAESLATRQRTAAAAAKAAYIASLRADDCDLNL